jgi:peptide/nickel transport system substrate-binding protein
MFGRASGNTSSPSAHSRRAGLRVAVAAWLTIALGSFVAANGLAPPGAGASSTSSGNVASYSLGIGDAFTWIFPLENSANYEAWDEQVVDSMWTPLYFVGKGSSTGIDYKLSVGKKPVYSDGDTTVTITLNRDYTWSDGQKVTSADIKFFFELDSAGKSTLGDYLPGEMPDDVTSVTYPGPYTVVLHLNHAYNPTWFTGNQLTWIYPMPAQTWDKTCTTCPVNGAATTPTGAKAVFTYLFKQSADTRTYTTNPLWKTVDGPWVISSYNPVTYASTFVANPHYTGPTKPRLSGYDIYTYTTGTTELNALRAGTLTFGYLPLSDISEASYFKSHGYTVKPWRFFYNEDMEFGYTSASWGALVKQLYIRQALQHLVTENLYISRALHGYGLPDYGVVADYPGSPYVSATLRKDPYPYDPSEAAKLLAAHGWKKGSGGVLVCKRPGKGSTDCGAGIPKGRPLSMPFMYSTGTTAFLAEVSAFETAAKSIGVDITLNPQTETTMFSIAGVCPTTPPCNYGIAGYAGYMWDYGQYQILPSGDNQFGKGNFWAGGYYTATAQRLIDAADSKGGLKPLYADENYLTKQVASLWFPLFETVVVVKKNLKGWETLNPYGIYVPSSWYYSS